jgi:uncharacterized membrane protein YgdD (TMEM256/DUF423 family)
MRRDWLIIAVALSGALAITAGAFGAHAHAFSGKPAEWLKTGGTYQLIHAVAALVLAQQGGWRVIAWALLAGAGIFAITLYLMALGAPHILGAVTPIGGALMIGGWLWLAIQELRHRS